MNLSIDLARQESIDVLDDGFIMEFERLDITITDSEVDNYFLETSYLEDSFIENIRNFQSLSSDQLFKSNEKSIESYESIVVNNLHLENPTKNHLKTSESLEDAKMSIANNCKKIYKDLMRPITKKLAKLGSKKNALTEKPETTQKKFKVQIQKQKNLDKSRTNNKNNRIQFRIVPALNLKPNCLDVIPSEFDKQAENYFTKCGDLVFYNI